MRVIALIGKKGCGKSEMANYINEKYGIRSCAFADSIKQISKILFQLSEDQATKLEEKEKVIPELGVSARNIYIAIGKVLRNDLKKYISVADPVYTNYNIFIYQVHQFLKTLPDKTIVLSDCRFPDEIDYLKKYHETIFIKIVRPGVVTDLETSRDESETALDHEKFNDLLVILNDGDLVSFRNKIKQIEKFI